MLEAKAKMLVLAVAMVMLLLVVRIAFTELQFPIPVRVYDRFPTPVPTMRRHLDPGAPYRVGGTIFAPVLVSRGKGAEWAPGGSPSRRDVVVIEVAVSESGRVTPGKVLRGISPERDASALEAVREWRYRPTTLRGQPVQVFLVVPMHFQGAV
jgi:TonB family protein